MLVQNWIYQEYYSFSLSFSHCAGPYSVLHDNKWRITSLSSVYRTNKLPQLTGPAYTEPIGCYTLPAQCIPDQAATVDRPSVYRTRLLQLTGPVYTKPKDCYSWPAQCIPSQVATVDRPSVYRTKRLLQLTSPVYTKPGCYSWPAQCILNHAATIWLA